MVKKKCQTVQSVEKKIMIDHKDKEISVSKQCRMIKFPRSQVYQKPKPISKRELMLRKLIDEIYTDSPTMGSRRISKEITLTHKLPVGRTRIRTLMREMDIQAIYPKKHLTIACKNHKKYPYLLRNVEINKVNQVWSTDITYIRMAKGFVYLTAVIDWYSRKVLSWKLSTTMDTALCTTVLLEALQKYGKPEIFNTDQGSQYTSIEFTSILKNSNIKISMDGRGRALDNIFVERLWRTVKQEEIYLKEYLTVLDVKNSLKSFFKKYNQKRRHQSLDYNYPDDIYFGKCDLKKAA